MDREEALRLLRGGPGGITEWNHRRKIGVIIPSLKNIDLSGAFLRDADLHDADLYHANLCGVDATHANFCNAQLSHALMTRAILTFADFRRAILRNARLEEADLTEVNLQEADLRVAHFPAATLHPTDSKGARFAESVFQLTRIHGDLSTADGLNHIYHRGPSSISVDTIKRFDELPERFLIGCGLDDDEIELYRAKTGAPIRHYSCFISYSHADKQFARRLHDQLQGRGIRCWLDEHQVLPGDKIHDVVNQAIRLWDKVLLCGSRASLTSWWVDNEIQSAIKKEQQLHKSRGVETLALIPINLDGFMFTDDWKSGWKDQITCRHAPSFTGWENDNAIFETQFEKVEAALRADENARPKPPKPLL